MSALQKKHEKPKHYEEIFSQQGYPYDQAMQKWPKARTTEFQNAIELIQFQPGCKILDIPSGNKYLKPYLPNDIFYTSHDACPNFSDSNNHSFTPLLPTLFQDETFDIIISIAGTHHLPNRIDFFEELYRIAKPGSQFVIADAHQDSKTAQFLDTFIDQHAPLGHSGNYLSERDLNDLKKIGWNLQSGKRMSYTWKFESELDIGQFLNTFFDLQNTTPENTVAQSKKILGELQGPNKNELPWELYYILATK